MARPTKYKPEYNEQAYNYCLLGATDKELASFFDVTESTITNWKREHPKFLVSLKQGKAIADAKVANSLYKSALGGHYITKEKSLLVDGAVQIVKLSEQVPPNSTSQIFWLKNRQPDKWRDKVDIDAKFNLCEVSLEWVEENFLKKMDEARVRQEQALLERAD